MDKELVCKLRRWAEEYENVDFISADPISFPHLYKGKKDIEIAGFVSAWLAYGKRELILRANEIVRKEYFGNTPYRFIMEWDRKGEAGGGASPFGSNKETKSFYRFYKYGDLFDLFDRLKIVYQNYMDLEAAYAANKAANVDTDTAQIHLSTPAFPLQKIFSGINGVPKEDSSSACKRIYMFLRWMCRKNSVVDFGIWNIIEPKDLIIPLDIHVYNISRELGLTNRNSADYKTAKEISLAIKEVFPNDPTRADFALFAYDIDRTRKKK